MQCVEERRKKMNDKDKKALYDAMKFLTIVMDRLISISYETYEELFNELNAIKNETEKTQK